MALSTIPVGGAGSNMQYEDPAVVGTWVDLPNCVTFGEIGSSSDFIDSTAIVETTASFAPGLSQPPEVELMFFDISNPGYEAFLAFADSKTTLRINHTMSNGRTAIRTVALGARKLLEATNSEVVKMSVSGQQTGAPTWGVTA